MPELTTAFAGSPRFAATILKRLAQGKFAPTVVLTQPDRPTGRGRKLTANPVKKLASELDLPVLQPPSLKDPQALEALANFEPDVLIVAAYGLILPKKVLKLPRFGCLNVHASLLPRWRGAAPIERAMMAGDTETGVCIMQMEPTLDTGPVYASARTPIEAETTAAQLEQTLAEAGFKLLKGVLEAIAAAQKGQGERPVPLPQNADLATYADKLTAADRVIDWQQSAAAVARQVMALAERMPARSEINGARVQLLGARTIEQHMGEPDAMAPGTLVDVSRNGLTVQCATDLLQITRVKVEGGKGKALEPAEAINGFKELFHPGARFAT